MPLMDRELRIELKFANPEDGDEIQQDSTCIVIYYARERVATQFAFGHNLEDGKQQCASRIYVTWMAHTAKAYLDEWSHSD